MSKTFTFEPLKVINGQFAVGYNDDSVVDRLNSFGSEVWMLEIEKSIFPDIGMTYHHVHLYNKHLHRIDSGYGYNLNEEQVNKVISYYKQRLRYKFTSHRTDNDKDWDFCRFTNLGFKGEQGGNIKVSDVDGFFCLTLHGWVFEQVDCKLVESCLFLFLFKVLLKLKKRNVRSFTPHSRDKSTSLKGNSSSSS